MKKGKKGQEHDARFVRFKHLYLSAQVVERKKGGGEERRSFG